MQQYSSDSLEIPTPRLNYLSFPNNHIIIIPVPHLSLIILDNSQTLFHILIEFFLILLLANNFDYLLTSSLILLDHRLITHRSYILFKLFNWILSSFSFTIRFAGFCVKCSVKLRIKSCDLVINQGSSIKYRDANFPKMLISILYLTIRKITAFLCRLKKTHIHSLALKQESNYKIVIL